MKTFLGLLNIIFATGSATGAPLGGILADGIGWRWWAFALSFQIFTLTYSFLRAFLLQVPAALLAILSVSIALKLPQKETSDFYSKLKRVDFGGAILLVTAVFLLLLALDRGGNISWNDNVTLASLFTSFVFFSGFGIVETHPAVAREPFLPRRIITDTSLLAAYLCNLFGLASSMCLIFHVTLYFQAVAGKSAAHAGLGLLPAVFGGVIGSLSGGIIMQKTGKYYWLTVGSYLLHTTGNIVILLVTGALIHSLRGASSGNFFFFSPEPLKSDWIFRSCNNVSWKWYTTSSLNCEGFILLTTCIY